MQIAVTKIHTKPGIAERFVNDLKKAVSNVMAKPDRKLGEMVSLKYNYSIVILAEIKLNS